MAHKRIKVISVPIDIVEPENLENEIIELTQQEGCKQICFVTVWDLLKAKLNKEFMNCLNKADLVLPVSKSILKGAASLKQEIPIRYNSFSTIIRILGILEQHNKSLYLLGSHKNGLLTAEHNLRATYPGLHIVGRYVGYYPKSVENDLISAIYKADPALLLYSDGLAGGNCWGFKRKTCFTSSIMLYSRDIIRIFAKQKKRISSETFDKGLEIWSEIGRNPFKIFLLFPYIWYKLMIIWYKCFKKY